MSDNQSINTTTSEPAIRFSEGSEVAPVSENRQRLNELAQQLASAVQRKRALVAKVDTLQRAKLAAQGDAVAARQQWSAKLRDADGNLTRDIQKLRANESSALSLAEEYVAMEDEIAAELPKLELELAEVADRYLSTAEGVTSDAAGQAYEQLLAQAGDSLAVAFALFSKAENGGVHYRQSASADELASKFFGRLGYAVRHRLNDSSVTDLVAQRLALPLLDLSAVDMGLVRSPARRSQLQAQISAGGAV
ncbi:TPA: hypothetical protein ACGCEE_001032 [Stenotrophomonas maltophilia]|uniref:hypothetical protein n=1 Tax=Stenotrophomonas maltophilia TaxID=40324 RepID=UPI001310EF46|nr:hypothetical protein [Stenotrophomonas maltophilia]MCF3549927.1 hypothetical protein [Stenotrophomonas maltophilia]MCF3558059.1 hypothetical protein [Stenotrophomonas maltophilia]MCF3561235.1 hypothetical protein [Stenotrophomonas maltophilia]UXB27758.1 hypothetical protein K7568_18485 [Stenotrophomonas maltophilia]